MAVAKAMEPAPRNIHHAVEHLDELVRQAPRQAPARRFRFKPAARYRGNFQLRSVSRRSIQASSTPDRTKANRIRIFHSTSALFIDAMFM